MAQSIKISNQQKLQLNSTIPSKTIAKSFGRIEDNVELHIYNNNNQLLFSEPNFQDYSFPDTSQGSNPVNIFSEIIIDPTSILNDRGYSSGKYQIKLNILRDKILNTTNNATPFLIKDISPSRRELKLTSPQLENTPFDTAVNSFISEIESSAYFRDFYINLGEDKYALGINLLLNKNSKKHELLIKTLEPLPTSIKSQSEVTIVELIVNPQIIDVDLGTTDTAEEGISLRGPNYKIDIRTNSSVPSDLYDYNNILKYSITSSYQHLLSQLKSKEVPAIDYTYIRPVSESTDDVAYHFENFIHFGSATERLKNFEYKLKLIEGYDKQLSQINSIPLLTSTPNNAVLDNKNDINDLKLKIIQGLDGYENFLYFTSGSSYSWPRRTLGPVVGGAINLELKFALKSVTSSEAQTWLGEERSNYPHYGGQLLSASLFDRENEYSLTRLVPKHIIDNPDNNFYQSFVHMIGQHFDQLWTHIDAITDINDSHHTRGISKDLVYFQLKSLGIDTFDQFENADLIEYILGTGTGSGNFYDVNHFTADGESAETLVTASNAGSIPKGDITKEIWKRLYHNAPYLLKTKGTERGIRALMSCYGVPSTILNIKEYGGNTTFSGPLKDLDISDTYKTFSYDKSGLALKGTTGTQDHDLTDHLNSSPTDGFFFIKFPLSASLLNTKALNIVTNNSTNTDPDEGSDTNYSGGSLGKTVEFRIKPYRRKSSPDANIPNEYLLFKLSGSSATSPPTFENSLKLKPYTGNDISSSNDANQYGKLVFQMGRYEKAETSNFPIFNGDFWNIHIGVDQPSGSGGIVRFGAYQSNFNKNISSYTSSFKFNDFYGIPDNPLSIATNNSLGESVSVLSGWGRVGSNISPDNPTYTRGVFAYIGGSPPHGGNTDSNLSILDHNRSSSYLGYSGSIQEVRYYFGELLNDSTFKKHALDPFMYNGNSISSSYEHLVMRLPLGSNDIQSSGSFHPDGITYMEGNATSVIEFQSSMPSAINVINFSGALLINITSIDGTSVTYQGVFNEEAIDGSVFIGDNVAFHVLNGIGAAQALANAINVHQPNLSAVLSLNANGLPLNITLTQDIPGDVGNTSNTSNNTGITFPEGTLPLYGITLNFASELFTTNFLENPDFTGGENNITSNLSGSTPSQYSDNSHWEEVVEVHHLPTPDTVGISMTSEKTRIDEGTVDDDILSYKIKSETSTLDRQPQDFEDLGVFLSPTNEINEDIIYTLGAFRLDDYIGSPSPSAQTASRYDDLKTIKDIYFKKVKRRYNYWDYLKVVQQIDHTLFKIIEQFVPFKANTKTGVLIEPHFLERSKFPRELPIISKPSHRGVHQAAVNSERVYSQTNVSSSYNTFYCRIDPERVINISGSNTRVGTKNIISTNNLSTITGSKSTHTYMAGQRKETGTNFAINVNSYILDEVQQSSQSPIRPFNLRKFTFDLIDSSGNIVSTVGEGYNNSTAGTDLGPVSTTTLLLASQIEAGGLQQSLGTGLTVTFTCNSDGEITSVKSVNPGRGYKVGDSIRIIDNFTNVLLEDTDDTTPAVIRIASFIGNEGTETQHKKRISNTLLGNATKSKKSRIYYRALGIGNIDNSLSNNSIVYDD